MAGKRKNKEGCWGKKTIKRKKSNASGEPIYEKYDYTFFRDHNGKYYYGKTEKEVREKIKKEMDSQKKSALALNNPTIINEVGLTEKSTFGDYVLAWLKTKKNSISATTYDSYEIAIYSRLINFTDFDLSGKQVASVNYVMIQRYLDALAKKYTRNSILKVMVPLKQCIKHGIINGDFQQNFFELIHMPTDENCMGKKREINAVTQEDIEIIYNECHRKHANGKDVYGDSAKIICILMYTGMRISEALVLKWENVDLENRIINVKEAQARIINRDTDNDGKKYIKTVKKTKTEKSNRKIPLPDRAVEILRYFGTVRKSEYVFITKNGTPYDKRHIQKTLDSVIRCTGLKKYSPHSLRHGYGSILLSNGVDIKIISELLGHSDITTTYNIYIEVFDKDKKKAADVFNNL